MSGFFKLLAASAASAALIACSSPQSDTPKTSDRSSASNTTLFYGGPIITMEGSAPQYVQAVVEKDGIIVYVGSQSGAADIYAGGEKYDLKGQTMLPGFIEPHAHPVSIGAFILSHDIVAPHTWHMPHKTYRAVTGHDNYLRAVAETVKGRGPEDTSVIWGYHAAWHGALTLDKLNAATGDVPTIIYQRSTHEMYLNDAAMKKFAVSYDDFTDPQLAGSFDKDNNHFWEIAYQTLRAGPLAGLFADHEKLALGMERMSEMMLENGLTAMGEPSFPNTEFKAEYSLLKAETERSPFYDVYLIPGFPEQFNLKMENEDFAAYIADLERYNTPQITFLPRQFKTFSDGAIYSMAFELLQPYYNCETCEMKWIIPPDWQKQIFDYYWDNDYKIHVHVTGDKGAEIPLRLVEAAMQRKPRTDHRTTFHHLGLVTDGQAQRMADMGIEASVNSYYLWAMGNKYSEVSLGPQRAHAIAPAGRLTEKGIPTSFHSDFSMAPAEPLTLAWAAATRIADEGKALRPDLGVSVFDAMKGITISAARTLDQEARIGSIKEGKVANFTLLAEDPFKVDPAHIKDIDVKGIIYRGVPHMGSQ